jgi:hypothetical protein
MVLAVAAYDWWSGSNFNLKRLISPALDPAKNRPPGKWESFAILPPLLPTETEWRLVSSLVLEHTEIRVGEVLRVEAEVRQEPATSHHRLSGYSATISCLHNCGTSQPQTKPAPTGERLTWSWQFGGSAPGPATLAVEFIATDDNPRAHALGTKAYAEVFDQDGYSASQLAVFEWAKWLGTGFLTLCATVPLAMLTQWGQDLYTRIKRKIAAGVTTVAKATKRKRGKGKHR